MSLVDTVLATIEQHKLLKQNDRVLIGLSGGPDSVALLHILGDLSKVLKLKLFIAHLDHKLRGPESRGDVRYVRSLARKFGRKIITGAFPVSSFAKDKGLSLEDAARRMRYEFFQEAAKNLGVKKIALGHTRDDQAETVLMRLIRGSGLRGLSSIPYRRNLGKYTVIRPLLDVTRDQINDFLKLKGVRPREDSSNRDSRFLRNKIRHKLIPYLEDRFNPEIKGLLVQLKDQAELGYKFIADYAKATFAGIAQRGRGRIVINEKDFDKLPGAIKSEVLRMAIERLKGDLAGIEYRHIANILSAVANRGSLDLPGNLHFETVYRTLVIHKCEDYHFGARKLKIPGTVHLGERGMVLKFTKLSKLPGLARKKEDIEYLDYDRLKFPLSLRARRQGDIFRPLGMRRRFKLKEFFINQKVPHLDRDRIPLLVSGGKICYVVGMRIGDEFKLTKKTKRALKIEIMDTP